MVSKGYVREGEVTVQEVLDYIEAKGLRHKDFADMLGFSHTVVHGWKARGSIPEKNWKRVRRVLEGDSNTKRFGQPAWPEMPTFKPGPNQWHNVENAIGMYVNDLLKSVNMSDNHSAAEELTERLIKDIRLVYIDQTLWNALLHVIPHSSLCASKESAFCPRETRHD